MLPLIILGGPTGSYKLHPRKHYRKALLNIKPFNDYSGAYNETALKTKMEGYENETSIVKNEIQSYVVDGSTVFFMQET